MNVIGIDPSLTCTGLIALDLQAGRIIDYQVVTSAPEAGLKSTDLARRLYELAEGVRSFCTRFPSLVAVEAQVGASMGRSSLASTYKLGAAYGAVLAACPTSPLTILPAEVKRRLTANKAATKLDCWREACKRLGMVEEDVLTVRMAQAKREAVLDALAVAVAAEPEIRRSAALVGGYR